MRPGLRRPHSHGGSSGPRPPATVYGLGGYDAATVFATAAAQGIQGNVAGFWARAIFWLTTITPAAASRLWVSCFAGAGTGHRGFTSGTNITVNCSGFFTGALSVGPPTFNLTSALRLIDIAYVWDQPAGRMRGFYQGVEWGSTATALAFLPNAAEKFCQGSRSTGQLPFDQGFIVGMCGGDNFIPTAAEIAAAHATSIANANASLPLLAAIPAKTTWLGQIGAAWNPPVIVTDTIGGQNLAIAAGVPGSLLLGSIPALWA